MKNIKSIMLIGITLLIAGCNSGNSPNSPTPLSYTIPYVSSIKPLNSNVLDDPRINVEVFGVPITTALDTGSRGFFVTKNLILSESVNVPSGTPGSIFYWSSGREYNGTWVTTTVTYPDAINSNTGQKEFVQSVNPVLIVESIACLAGDWPNSCGTPSVTRTTGPHDETGMNMGIGFDRTGHQQVPENDQNNQQYNPFLNLKEMKSGSMKAGYIIGLQNVQVGLTPLNTSGGFAYGSLAPTGYSQVPGSPPDWQPATGNVTLTTPDGISTTYPTGEAVIDIGISDMLLTLDGQPTSGYLTSGSVTVTLFGANGTASYTFSPSATTTPVAPSDVAWTGVQPGLFSQNQPPFANNFVNTGRDVLNCFDYLYDAADGYVGLRLNNESNCSAAHVVPSATNLFD
jgi:hypothetical protein